MFIINNMEKTLRVINELKKDKLILDYAIGGGIAVIFYTEPVLTYDLDIFYIPADETKGLIDMTSIYRWFKTKGYKTFKEHIVIGELPVQLIPVYNDLVRDAVENARPVKYKKTETKVIRVEYLIAIMLQTYRPRDKERMIRVLDEAKVDKAKLQEILQKYKLIDKYNDFKAKFYEK